MISADFYPTLETQYTVEYTDFINNLTYDDTETMAEPYYMGYIPWENIPTLQHMSKMNVVSDVDDAYVEFVDVTEPENVPWFFTGGYSSSPYSTSGTTIYIDDNNQFVHPTNTSGSATNLANVGFFNNLEIQRVGSSGYFSFYVFYNITNTTTTPETISSGGSYLYYSGVTNLAFENYLKWKSGEIQLSISITIGAIQETINFDYEDFATGACTKQHTNGSIDFYLSDAFVPYNTRDMQPDNTSAGWSRQNATVKLHADIDGVSKPYITNGLYWHSGYSDEKFIRLDNITTLLHHVDGYAGYIMGGFKGKIPIAFFTYAVTGRYYVFGNMLVQKYTNSQTRIARIIPISDFDNFIAPFATRIQIQNTTLPYGFSDTIAYPLFNDDNSPKWEYVTGLQEDIQDQLQEWQYTNITDNTFTEDDIPEYEPPGPEPGPGGEPDEGDRGKPIPKFGNTPGMTEFVHYAAMSPFAINELATQLWDKPDSFWQKIVASTSENPMDYFISLRYYPVQFNKGDGKTDIHIGRGGQLHIANNYYPLYPVEDFDCGSITIQRQYNNFLDYAPYTSISIFLPFAGIFELNPTIVMGRTISLWLSVDVSDGSAVWEVYNETDHQPVLIKQCRMAAEIPLSGLDASQMAANVINASLQTAQHALGSVTTDLNSKAGVAAQALGGNGKGAMSGAISTAFNGPQTILTGLGDAYNLAQASKEIPQYTGGSSGAAACGMNHTPYIVYRRPLCTNPTNFAHAVGYLSNKTATISTLSGFTTCRNVDVSGIDQATDTEKAQIKQILESGFYA